MTTDPVHEHPLPDAMAQLFAARLTTGAPVLVGGRFVHLSTTVDSYGSLVIDITRTSFDADDRAERVTLHPSTPLEIPPPAVTSVAENVPTRVIGNRHVGTMDEPGPEAA